MGVVGADWAAGRGVAGFFTCAGDAGASWALTASGETQKPANVTTISRQQVSFISEGDVSQTGVFDEAEEQSKRSNSIIRPTPLTPNLQSGNFTPSTGKHREQLRQLLRAFLRDLVDKRMVLNSILF